MLEIIEKRRQFVASQISKFQTGLIKSHGYAKGKACIYTTGSYGRGEASTFSDLDIFIVGEGTREQRKLTHLNEICMQAELIEMTREHQFPEFSGDGEYLTHYSIGELISSLGKPEDDATNTFTARLLLLLESHCLVEDTVYKSIISQVIQSYWRDYEDHKNNFIPGFLANDILRLWSTFCVNYEARTKNETEDEKAKRRLKNYKLKHSRLLTCYSALIYLLQVYSTNQTVTPVDCQAMVALTPTRRIEHVATQRPSLNMLSEQLMAKYAQFLEVTDLPEPTLKDKFKIEVEHTQLKKSARAFGDVIFNIMQDFRELPNGNLNPFYRHIFV